MGWIELLGNLYLYTHKRILKSEHVHFLNYLCNS